MEHRFHGESIPLGLHNTRSSISNTPAGSGSRMQLPPHREVSSCGLIFLFIDRPIGTAQRLCRSADEPGGPETPPGQESPSLKIRDFQRLRELSLFRIFSISVLPRRSGAAPVGLSLCSTLASRFWSPHLTGVSHQRAKGGTTR